MRDEIGAHLHPTWKMRIVGSLRRALPAMQFIASTHDPLCLRGLVAGEEVAVMRRGEDQRAIALTGLPGDFWIDRHFGTTLRESLMYEAIDRLVVGDRHGHRESQAGLLLAGWRLGQLAGLLSELQPGVPGQPTQVRLGKAMQFPLANETGRVRSHNANVADEEPFRLLINPCTEQPSAYLTFDDQGLIHARVDASGQPNKRGEVSIAVYALQRQDLVEARLKVLNQLRFQIEQLRHRLECTMS